MPNSFLVSWLMLFPVHVLYCIIFHILFNNILFLLFFITIQMQCCQCTITFQSFTYHLCSFWSNIVIYLYHFLYHFSLSFSTPILFLFIIPLLLWHFFISYQQLLNWNSPIHSLSMLNRYNIIQSFLHEKILNQCSIYFSFNITVF